MRRAELMGPPGAGKTTILAAAAAARNLRSLEFMRAEEVAGRSAVSPAWHLFSAFVDAAYAGTDGVGARRLRSTRRAVMRARRIEGAPGEGIVLADESLCQRGLSLALTREQGEATAYFALMPVPVVVFVVTADVEVVVARNQARAAAGTGIDRSTYARAADLACRAAATQLRERGVAVVEINAERPVEDSVAAILLALAGLER